MERLKEEVSKREAELSQIEQEIKRTYAECKRHLGQKLSSKRLPIEPDQEARETDHSGSREQELKKKLRELNECLSSKETIKEQNYDVQKQPVVSTRANYFDCHWRDVRLSPLSMGRVVYSSTPFTPFYPPCSVPSTSMPSLVEQYLQTQQPTSVLPVVSVGNFVSQSDCLLCTAVTLSSPSVCLMFHQQHSN